MLGAVGASPSLGTALQAYAAARPDPTERAVLDLPLPQPTPTTGATPSPAPTPPGAAPSPSPGPTGTDDARRGADATSKRHADETGVRHDAGSNAFRVSSYLGMAGGLLDWARWGTAVPYHGRWTAENPFSAANVAGPSIKKWLWSAAPLIGPGINNDVVPNEHGWFKKAYATSNGLGTFMSVVHASIAIPNLAVGYKQGWDADDKDHSTFSHFMHGFQGLVATRAGRTGLIGSIGPVITASIILGAGWHARGDGLMAVLRAGQMSPLRGDIRFGYIGMAMTPIFYLNESGSLDFLNVGRPTDDTRGAGEVFSSGITRIPEAMRSLSLPFVPKAWMPDVLEPDRSAAP